MTNRRTVLLWFALASNLLLAVVTVALYGWTLAGIHVAARNTARFASLWFMVAFATPGLIRFLPSLPSEARLTHAYVSAHLIHFAVVAVMILAFEPKHLVQAPGKSAAIILIGFLIVVTAGLTASPRTSRVYVAVHAVALYALFGIFFLAFVQNRFVPLRLLVIPLALAVVLRVAGSRLPVRIARVTSRDMIERSFRGP